MWTGRVAIGGLDVRESPWESLMDQVSMVFQRVYLFHDTIENNIKFGCPNATHQQVMEASKESLLPRLHLRPAGWVRHGDR